MFRKCLLAAKKPVAVSLAKKSDLIPQNICIEGGGDRDDFLRCAPQAWPAKKTDTDLKKLSFSSFLINSKVTPQSNKLLTKCMKEVQQKLKKSEYQASDLDKHRTFKK